jgi:tetratricopeptide (TPR) repeat protein
MRAKIYVHLNDLDKAINDITQAIKHFPRAKSYFMRAEAYLLQHKYDKALADCNKGLELKPKKEEGYFVRGAIYRSLKEYKQAIENYTYVIALAPKHRWTYCPNLKEAYYFRGISHDLSGDLPQALADYYACLNVQVQLDQLNVLDKLHKHSKEAILAAIQQLPRETAVELLSQALDRQTVFGKRFDVSDDFELSHFKHNQSTKREIIATIKNLLDLLLANQKAEESETIENEKKDVMLLLTERDYTSEAYAFFEALQIKEEMNSHPLNSEENFELQDRAENCVSFVPSAPPPEPEWLVEQEGLLMNHTYLQLGKNMNSEAALSNRDSSGIFKSSQLLAFFHGLFSKETKPKENQDNYQKNASTELEKGVSNNLDLWTLPDVPQEEPLVDLVYPTVPTEEPTAPIRRGNMLKN